MTLGPGLRSTPLPKGFRASGIHCGVRKYRPDLGLILSDRDSRCAAVYTLNALKAAPVVYDQKITPSQNVRAIITNSGEANAGVGPKGIEHNLEMAKTVAKSLGIETDQVLTASTGVIGIPLSIEKIKAAIPELVERANDQAEPFSVSILTTDLIPKTASTKVKLGQGDITLTGICKGSGMIHPNMATMLAYILTDANIPITQLQALLQRCNAKTFNRISVDGDMSTNDSVFLLANGAADLPPLSEEDMKVFELALRNLCEILAKSIVKDGEGATKMFEVQILGAPTEAVAEKLARQMTTSPLVKTAIHGADPNWGRIVANLGTEPTTVALFEKLTLRVQNTVLFSRGEAQNQNLSEAAEKMRAPDISISVDLAHGDETAIAWGCDLSKKYVEINSEYTT